MAKGKNVESPGANGNVELGNPGENLVTGSDDLGLDSAPTIGGIPVTNPAAGGHTATDAPRKRGRPAGSGTKSAPKEKATASSIKGIEKLLYSLHIGVSSLTGIDELKIDKEESALMSEALAEVASHYNVAVDPKVLAWLGFAGVMGTIYGPRIGAWKMRRSAEKKGTPVRASNVVPMPSASGLINGFPLPGATG
jgi:hypothetical protein